MWALFRCNECGSVALEHPTTEVSPNRDGAVMLRSCGIVRSSSGGDDPQFQTAGKCHGALEFVGYLALVPPATSYRADPWTGGEPARVSR
jgi:hypothetical protein